MGTEGIFCLWVVEAPAHSGWGQTPTAGISVERQKYSRQKLEETVMAMLTEERPGFQMRLRE